MKSLIATFLKYPILGNSVLILILIFGYFGFKTLNSTLFPESESKIITVQAIYPGASPEEMEEGVILKIEDNLKGVTGIERISSISNENGGVVTVEVLKRVKTEEVLIDVKNAVEKIPSFPVGMEPPVIFINEKLNMALTFALSGSVDLKALKQKAQQVENELRTTELISKVSLTGFPDEEIEISLLEDNLRAFELSFNDVAAAVRKANLDITGGTIKGEREELLVRGRGKEYYASDLRDIIVKSNPDGTIIKLWQIAEVKDKWSDQPNRSWFNGHASVVVRVDNTLDEDILAINDFLYTYIDEFNQKNTDIQATIINDGSTSLRQRIAILTTNGLQGAFFVLLFLALFLDHRLAFWVALGIPISFAGMFILASFYGLTINVISLFGMILVVGILVDDGIVIAENIFQKYEQGMKPHVAALAGTMEVLPAVFSAVATTVVAFGAFFFLDGRLGEFAPNMAFVVISTLTFSLVEGALILPAHVAHSQALSHDKKPNLLNSTMEKVMNYMRDRLYGPFLRFCMENKFFTMVISISWFMITVAAIKGGIIKTTFFPQIERNDLSVDFKMPAGTREQITESWLNHIEQAVIAVNEDLKKVHGDTVNVIKGIQKDIGPNSYTGKVNVILIDAESRLGSSSFDITNMIREKCGPIYGAESSSFGVAAAFGKAVSIALKGYDIPKLEAAKESLREELSAMTSLRDVTVSDQPGLREVNLTLKDEALALGLQLQDILSQVRAGFFGAEVQRLQRGEDEVKIWVRYEEADRSSIDKMMDMWINIPSGQKIPLRELANYTIDRGVIGINHLDGMREIRVEADVADPKASISDLNAEIEEQVIPKVLAAHPGVQFSFEGQSRQNAKVGKSMAKVMPIVLIIMFAIILFTFRSFWQTLAVYLMIPLGVIGVGWGHWIHGMQISMLSGFGIIALIGVMVNDSLVYVSTLNGYIKQGMGFMEAVFKSGVSRFRPILLTSVTTIAGLGPLILEKSFQAQFLVPMAVTVAYGLIISTFTTIIFLPILLIIFNRMKIYAVWLWTGQKPTELEVETAYRELESDKKYGEIEL